MRNAVPWLLILLVLGSLGLFAWMTAYPEAAWIERAEEWPVVGPWAQSFRRAYVPAETPEPESPDEEAEAEGGFEIVEILPPPPGPPPDHVEVLSPVWLEPGLQLHAEPDEDSPELGVVESYRRVVPRGVRGPWHRVEVAGRLGWVRIDREPTEPGEPLLGRDPAPVLPLPARPPDEEKLARARILLDVESPRPLGPYDLYTDVTNATLLHRLGQVARTLEDVYRERFGVEPVGEPAEAVALFAEEADYRTYQSGEARLEGLPAAGHAGHGLVALYVGLQEPDQVAAILIHELGHLLNRRALGPALPPWLDEGLAEDLTWSRLDPFGRPVPGTWGGLERQKESVIVRFGGAAVRGRYRRAAELGHLIPLAELFRMEWRPFVHYRDGLAYAQAGLWVRWLLDAAPPGRFRRFLEDTARGEPITEERLLETMEMSWEEMEARVGEWVG